MRDQLVSEYLEMLPGDILEQHQESVTQFTHRRRGIYALYANSKLYYVGLAIDLKRRLNQHLKDRHSGKWDKFSVYLTLSKQHPKEIESLVLRIAQPKGNKVKGKFEKAKDLKQELKNVLKNKQTQELKRIFGREKVEAKSKHGSVADKPGNVMSAYPKALGKKIRAKDKAKTYWAVIRKNGTLKFNGKIYTSPSAPGGDIVKHACDGWYFWEYEQAPGDWVKLDVLRR